MTFILSSEVKKRYLSAEVLILSSLASFVDSSKFDLEFLSYNFSNNHHNFIIYLTFFAKTESMQRLLLTWCKRFVALLLNMLLADNVAPPQ